MKQRLPKFRDVIPVYAVIAFFVYAWAIVVFLWNLPSWLFYLYLNEILTILAYRMVASFAESLLVLSVLLGMCIILPPGFLKDVFVRRGTSTAICILGSIVMFWNHFLSSDMYFWMAVSFFLAILLGIISTRVQIISRSLEWLSDSMIIFLYVLMPLSLISLVAVLIRNVV